jgi:hypothetical protein
MNRSKRIVLGATAAACVIALLVTAGTASSYAVGSPEDQLATTRAELIALRGSLETPSARLWLSRSVASLGWVVGADCWIENGASPLGPGASRCVDAIKVTVRRLTSGDPSGELAAKARAQVLEIVDVVRGFALEAESLASSWRELETGYGPANLWAIQHDIAQGDRDVLLDPRWAVTDYLRAWGRHGGPGLDVPPTIAFGAETIQPKLDYNPAGSAEAFAVRATGSTLSRLSVYVDPASTAASLVAGIYADGGGGPGQLLAQGSTPLAQGGGDWNTVHVPTMTLTPGETYWIAILTPAGGGTLRFRDRCCRGAGTSLTVMSAASDLTSLPAAWSSGRPFKDGPLSVVGAG